MKILLLFLRPTLRWRKVKNQPTVDFFLIHRCDATLNAKPRLTICETISSRFFFPSIFQREGGFFEKGGCLNVETTAVKSIRVPGQLVCLLSWLPCWQIGHRLYTWEAHRMKQHCSKSSAQTKVWTHIFNFWFFGVAPSRLFNLACRWRVH